MQAIIDIGDQKTGSKSRQDFLRGNRDELRKNDCCFVKSTKIGPYDMGLSAYAGSNNHAVTFSEKKCIDNSECLDEFIENSIANELELESCSRFIFSFEGLIGLEKKQIEKLVKMLYRHFSEILIIGFLRRQDRKAVSSYTTRLRNHGATDLDILFNRGSPRGVNYYKKFESWSAFVKPENIVFINYDECLDVRKSFIDAAEIPGDFKFEETKKNRSISALGAEVLRQFNISLAYRDEYKGRANAIRALIRDYYVGEPLRPSCYDAQICFQKYSDSNMKLAESLGAKKKYFFDEDFSEYPDEFFPVELSLAEAEEYVKAVLSHSE